MSKISQREARRLRKRVEKLEAAIEAQRRTYSQEWFMAVNIVTREMDAEAVMGLRTARKLGHGVVIIADEHSNRVLFMALPHPKVNQ